MKNSSDFMVALDDLITVYLLHGGSVTSALMSASVVLGTQIKERIPYPHQTLVFAMARRAMAHGLQWEEKKARVRRKRPRKRPLPRAANIIPFKKPSVKAKPL